MYTRCPECSTLFSITAKQLAVAQGTVRCGQCMHVFLALENLYDKAQETEERFKRKREAQQSMARALKEPTDSELFSEDSTEYLAIPTSDSLNLSELDADLNPDKEAESTEAASTSPEESGLPQANETNDIIPETETTGDNQENSGTPSHKDILIEEIERKRRRKKKKDSSMTTIAWAAIIIVMMLLLIGQYAFFLRADLARYPEFRPWLEKLCQIAKCEIPLQRDLTAIEISDRDVRTHPEISGALLINAIIINKAGFTQSFPEIQIALSSMEKKKVSSRRFKPHEYLDKSIDIDKGMPSGKAVIMRLEISDPGKEIVNFEFEFF
jgi:predicted Zn finger-like uncharacterized protein